MTYLVFAIVCSSAIAILFKYSEKINTQMYVVTSANYLIAFVTSIIMIIFKEMYKVAPQGGSFFSEISKAFGPGDYIMSPHASLMWGLIIGPVAGMFFFSSFIFYQKSVKDNGVSLSGTFSKLGILVPMVFSIIIWKEIPSAIQTFGIILTIIAIILVNQSSEENLKFSINTSLMALFFLGGMAEFSNKIYQKYAMIEYKEMFLFMVFFSAFLISTYYIFKEKCKITKKDIAVGFAVGIPNLFTSYFLIMALDTIKATLAFPVFGAGTILVITGSGVVLFKEKISFKNKIATGLVVVAIILMNI